MANVWRRQPSFRILPRNLTGTTNVAPIAREFFEGGGAPAGPAGLKTWNGLAKASIKTINGLALASVKTWNGLA